MLFRSSENDYPRIDGSTATLPLSYALYRLATGEGQDSAIGKIVHNKTTESYIKLINREVDIILSYAPPQELMEAIEEAGEGKPAKYIKKSGEYAEEIEVAPLLLKPVGKDALVFLVNQGNPVSNISVCQAYRTLKILCKLLQAFHLYAADLSAQA